MDNNQDQVLRTACEALAALANFIVAYAYVPGSPAGKIPVPYPNVPSPDGFANTVAVGLELLERARAMAAQQAEQSRQKVRDFEAAAKNASGQAKDQIDNAKRDAEKKAEEEQNKADELGAVIGSVAAHLPKL